MSIPRLHPQRKRDGSYAWHRALNDLDYLPEAAERLAGLAEKLDVLTTIGREVAR